MRVHFCSSGSVTKDSEEILRLCVFFLFFLSQLFRIGYALGPCAFVIVLEPEFFRTLRSQRVAGRDFAQPAPRHARV